MLGRPEYWQVQCSVFPRKSIPGFPPTNLSCKFVRDLAPQADLWQSAHCKDLAGAPCRLQALCCQQSVCVVRVAPGAGHA